MMWGLLRRSRGFGGRSLLLGKDGIRCALNRLLGTLISVMDSLEIDSGVRFHFVDSLFIRKR